MRAAARWGLVLLAVLAMLMGSGSVARAEYPHPMPPTQTGQRIVDMVRGWNYTFPGSVDSWALVGTSAHVIYVEGTVLASPSMQADLRGKLRQVGATSVSFATVRIPYPEVEAAIASLEERYASLLATGALGAIYPTPGVSQRSIQVVGESAGVAVLQSQVGTVLNGIPVVYRVGAQPAPAGLDVYTTPGLHLLNGRQWRTRCEPYSQTKRCRTEIKATTISRSGGRYVQTTGWAFNNLTYAASPRSLWRGNPLGNTGEWTAAGARQWRTECDSALTGRNACRSFVMSTFIALENGRYTQKTDWQFNNMVRFTS